MLAPSADLRPIRGSDFAIGDHYVGGLLVFACEFRQVLRASSVGVAGVSRVLSASPVSLLPVVARFQEEYAARTSFGGQCHLVRLFLACLQSLGAS